MINQWRISKPEPTREILTKVFPSPSLDVSVQMAQDILKLVSESGYAKEDVQLSATNRDLLVILHGHSAGIVPDGAHDLASLIDARLALL